MSQYAAGVIVRPSASAHTAAAHASAAPAQACGAETCDASPPAGPSPPPLPSPPRLCASLSAQEAPLDLSHRSQEPIQVKVEQSKQEQEHPMDQGSNILRSQLNMQRAVQTLPTPEPEKMDYNNSGHMGTGAEHKQWKLDVRHQYPQHVPQRVAAAEDPGAGGQYQRVPQLIGGPQYREKLPTHFQHQGPLPPGHHALPPMTYTTLEPRNPLTPIHVQIPSYQHGPVHRKMAAPYPGDCSPLQNAQQGSAFSTHQRGAIPLPGKDHDSEVRRMNYQAAWTLTRESEQRKPEVLTISMLMQPTPATGGPQMAPPMLGGYSPNPYGLPPHSGQGPAAPHWGSSNWMANAAQPVQQTTPPGDQTPPSAAQAQPQGRGANANARPFKTFNYDEHLGEPTTRESRLGKLPFDTRDNYERFLREQRAQLPPPSIDMKARKNSQSPDGDQQSSTEENADVAAYRARRQKNNLAAKRSRAARHIKEDDIAITSMYFCELIKEYRHALGVQKLVTQQLQRQLGAAYFRQ